ncbi:hypothetical protein FQR65_LT14369 [Abscondita terminalis]|nr:hypothetical protein FQR65_LT14369 [Abscondita terminalis]
MCRASEISRTQVKELRSEVQANSIKKVVPIYKKAQDEGSSRSGNAMYLCKKCNTKHEARNCPAYGKRCLNCNKLNHYKIGCKLRKRGSRKINEIAEASEQEVENIGNLFTNSITTVQFKNEVSDPTCNLIKNVHGVTDVWTHTICLENNYFIEFKLDTGSQVNTLPINMYNQLNLCKTLLEYRSTTIPSLGVSPSELLMSRVLRTKLPITFQQLKPKLQHNVKNKILRYQNKYKTYVDKRASRNEIEFRPNQNVVIRTGNVWLPGKIVSKTKYPRSYIVKDSNNRILRRNTYHLRPSVNNEISRDVENNCESDLQIIRENSNERVTNNNQRTRTRVIRRPTYLNDYVVY